MANRRETLLNTATLKRTLEKTNNCYKQALIDEYPNLLSWSSMSRSVFEIKHYLCMCGCEINNGDISKRYLTHICRLDTSTLSIIIEADKKGKQLRSPITIHAILDELFERSVNFRS